MTGADRVKVTPQGQSLSDYGVGSEKLTVKAGGAVIFTLDLSGATLAV